MLFVWILSSHDEVFDSIMNDVKFIKLLFSADDDNKIIYKGKVYDFIEDGFLQIGEQSSTPIEVYYGSVNPIPKDIKPNYKVYTYEGDVDNIYLFDSFYGGGCMLRRTDIKLPSYKNSNEVIDKIVLSTYKEHIKKDVIITDKEIILSLVTCMIRAEKECEKNVKVNQTKCYNVYIYYKNYPAYEDVGNIFKTSIGKWGFTLSHADYIRRILFVPDEINILLNND